MKENAQENKVKIYIVSTVAITLWGMSYIWTNQLIALNIPIFYFVFVRILCAGILLYIFNLIRGKIQKIQKRDFSKFLLLAFCEPFIYFICETSGLKETGSPTLSAMIIATIPIFSIASGILFFKEKISLINILGILLSLGGIILVTMSKGELGERFILGIVYLLIAVLAEVGHASLTKSLSGNYSSETIVMYQFIIGSVFLFPLFLTNGLDDFNLGYFSKDVWYPLICLTILCSSVAFTLWVSTIKSLGVAKSSIFSALIPVATAMIAWAIGHEHMNQRQWLGIAISTFGVILSQYTQPAIRKKTLS